MNAKVSNAAKKPEADAPTEGENQVRFAAARKYQGIVEKNPVGDYNPTWAKRDNKFTLGHAPKSERSVFGILYGLAGANLGKTGKELAAMLRWYDFPNRKRSEYLDGVPPLGWAEGYIDGAVTKGYLKLVAEPKAEAPKAPASK